MTNIHKQEYSQCNLAQWTINESMNTGHTKLFGTKSCNLKSILRQSSLNMKFFDMASKYELPGCIGKYFFLLHLMLMLCFSLFALIGP